MECAGALQGLPLLWALDTHMQSMAAACKEANFDAIKAAGI